MPAEPTLKAPRVYSPCERKWEFMHRAGLRQQFCGQCRLPVHNLSALTKGEAELFLAETKGRRTCITYEMRPDGTMVNRSFRERLRWWWPRCRWRTFSAWRVLVLVRVLSSRPLGQGPPQR